MNEEIFALICKLYIVGVVFTTVWFPVVLFSIGKQGQFTPPQLLAYCLIWPAAVVAVITRMVKS